MQHLPGDRDKEPMLLVLDAQDKDFVTVHVTIGDVVMPVVDAPDLLAVVLDDRVVDHPLISGRVFLQVLEKPKGAAFCGACSISPRSWRC